MRSVRFGTRANSFPALLSPLAFCVRNRVRLPGHEPGLEVWEGRVRTARPQPYSGWGRI